MRPIHIRIGHDDDFVIAELRNIKIISVSFRKTATKCVDHRLDFRVRQHLVYGSFFYIENFTPDRQYRLKGSVSSHLGRTAGGITLYNEDFALFRIFRNTVGQFAVGIKRELLPSQHIRLRFFLGLTNFGSLLCTGKDGL